MQQIFAIFLGVFVLYGEIRDFRCLAISQPIISLVHNVPNYKGEEPLTEEAPGRHQRSNDIVIDVTFINPEPKIAAVLPLSRTADVVHCGGVSSPNAAHCRSTSCLDARHGIAAACCGRDCNERVAKLYCHNGVVCQQPSATSLLSSSSSSSSSSGGIDSEKSYSRAFWPMKPTIVLDPLAPPAYPHKRVTQTQRGAFQIKERDNHLKPIITTSNLFSTSNEEEEEQESSPLENRYNKFSSYGVVNESPISLSSSHRVTSPDFEPRSSLSSWSSTDVLTDSSSSKFVTESTDSSQSYKDGKDHSWDPGLPSIKDDLSRPARKLKKNLRRPKNYNQNRFKRRPLCLISDKFKGLESFELQRKKLNVRHLNPSKLVEKTVFSTERLDECDSRDILKFYESVREALRSL